MKLIFILLKIYQSYSKQNRVKIKNLNAIKIKATMYFIQNK